MQRLQSWCVLCLCSPVAVSCPLLTSPPKVIECRETLAWSFVLCYFEPDEDARALFEHSQNLLEEQTEKMSTDTERPVPTIIADRTRMLGAVAVLRKYMRAVQAWRSATPPDECLSKWEASQAEREKRQKDAAESFFGKGAAAGKGAPAAAAVAAAAAAAEAAVADY